MTIVSVRRLQDYMSGLGLNVNQTQAAEDVLAGVQAELERYLNRPVELVTVTEVPVMHRSGWVETSVTPVVSTTTPGFYVVNGQLRPLYTMPRLEGFAADATVTYTAGYDGTAPGFADVRLAILRVAAREMEPRHDDTRSVKVLNTISTPSVEVSRKGAGGWQPHELAQFDRLRLRVVAAT